MLAARGINERDQVIRALSSPDSELRIEAAAFLVGEKDRDAAQLIRQAAARETNPVVLVNMESMLWSLGFNEGQLSLERLCKKKDTSRNTLVDATQQLSFRHKGGLCAPALEDAYHAAAAATQRLQIILVLQQVSDDIPPSTRADALAFAAEASQSPDLEVRVEARQLRRDLLASQPSQP